MPKKQPIIADSSTVAEFIGAHTGAQAIMWPRNFLEELGFRQKGATCMYQDNMSTIRLIGHKGNTGRMKHDLILFVSKFAWALSVSNTYIQYYQNDRRYTHEASSTPALPVRMTLRITSFPYVPWPSLQLDQY